MGMFGGLREGCWWTRSESDKRFNGFGAGCVGGFAMPSDCKEWLENKSKELGVPIPDDLEWAYMKD